MGKTKPGPGADHRVGQRPQPSPERGELAAGGCRLSRLLDQIRRPLKIARRQGVAHCFEEHPFLLVPRTGSAVQFRHQTASLPLQALPQQVGKKMVIAIPAPLVIQGNDKEVAAFEILQHRL